MQDGNFPLVSVAVITYNQKDFLYECIESILEQEYPNFEIIVADDASTDGTQDMLREYDSRYPGKFVLKLAYENQGITENSNAANFACEGKYIAWMGGDDLMLPEKISKQVEFMEANPDCTISYHDLDVFDSDSNETLYLQSKKVKPRQGNIKTSIKYGVFNGACSTMVRASKTPDSGYNRLLPVASDWCYWVESLGNGGEINYIDQILGRYRRHSGNVTKKKEMIGQNTIDHLNTCNYLIKEYPEYFSEIMHRYAINVRSLRKTIPYLPATFTYFKLTLDFRALFGCLFFALSFGKIKI
jgi:glycosyltransferase involved in cell wall biosynthesis